MTACTSNIPSSQATQHAPFGQKQQTRSSCVSKAKCLATSYRPPTKIKKTNKKLLKFAQSKNWLHTQRRRRRNSCHPSKLVRWGSLWATFGHSLAPPPTHTHRTCPLPSVPYLCPVPLLSVPLYTSPPTHRDLPYQKCPLPCVPLHTTFTL